MKMQPASRSTAALHALSSHSQSEAEVDRQLHHSRIHEPPARAGGVVLQWELLESLGDWRPDDYTVAHVAFYRAKVPGGWLVAMKGSYQANGMGLTFYPDPLDAW